MLIRKFIISILLCLLLSRVEGQGVTSSGVVGRVIDEYGMSVENAVVIALHEPTGTRARSVTNSEGRYRMIGLRVGGPYTVTVRSDYAGKAKRTHIYLSLQQESTVDVRLVSEGDDTAFELEEFVVEASNQDSIFNEAKKGSGSIISSADINLLPSVSRSLNDIVRLDPRISVVDRENGTVSAGGKNFRYNTLLIDGVPTNDSFGLSESGMPALKQPFSLESIAEVNVQMSPYSVETAGFTGAAISAITKSGTNEVHGSVFGFYRNTSMVGELYDSYQELGELEPELVPFQDFQEYTVGFSVGGPIIKDKLFFFALYEQVEESIVNDPGDFYPSEEDLEAINEVIKNKYQFFPGDLDDPGNQVKTDDKYLLKLDWNISERHRLSARYQLVEGLNPNYPGYDGDEQIAYSSHFYDELFKLEDMVFELFSHWTSNFQTEFLISQKQYSKTREPYAELPEIQISGITSINARGDEKGSIWMGTPGSSQLNFLNVDTTVMRFKLNWLVGSHQIKGGVQYEVYDNENGYINNRYGSYLFLGLENFTDLVDGSAESYSLTLPVEGSSGIADWSMGIASAYIEDDWNVSSRLNINFGLRIDMPVMDDVPPEAAGSKDAISRTFEETFGSSNIETVDGNYVIQPRFGFNYAIDEERKTQIRGGGGLFFGTAPHVWISNIFINNGQTLETYYASKTSTPEFSADINNPPELGSLNARAAVDSLAEDFKMPTDWKANIAVDRKLFADVSLTLEAAFSWTKDDIHYIHQNLGPQPASLLTTGYLPDGRILYSNQEARARENGYANVIKLVNTDQGSSEQYTVLIQRPMVDGWSFRLGYTNTNANSVNDGNSATSVSNWTNNVGFNPNDEILGRSAYETTHRFVLSGSYQIKWNDRHKTTITLVHEARSGRPFSYVFGRDRGAVDMNRDGNSLNDLLYIPTGIDDPLVRWGDAKNSGRDTDGVAFMEFIDQTKGLREYKGQVVPRNSGTSPWVQQMDISITHEIQTWEGQKLEIIFAIENFGNLLNDQWGREKRPRGSSGNFTANVPILNANRGAAIVGSGSEATVQDFYVYSPNTIDYDADNLFEVRSFSSRWAMQLGLRYSF